MIPRGLLLLFGSTIFLYGRGSEASTSRQSISGGGVHLAKDIPPPLQPSSTATTGLPHEEIMYITKRDGRLEPLDGSKVSLGIHRYFVG